MPWPTSSARPRPSRRDPCSRSAASRCCRSSRSPSSSLLPGSPRGSGPFRSLPRRGRSPTPATTEHVDAIVIGAGLAGLTAAHQLSRTRRVALVEARTRVGGRAHSVPAGGGVIEAGATWFWANEPVIRAAATDLGLEIYSQDIDGDALFETADGGAQRLGGNPIDGPPSASPAARSDWLRRSLPNCPPGRCASAARPPR